MRHLLVLGMVGAAACALAGDPIVNSGFERHAVPSSPYFCPAGSSALPGWTIGGGTSSQGVDVLSLLYGPEFYTGANRQSVLLGGSNGPGSIKQTFPITPGVVYILSYASAGYHYSGPTETWAAYINGVHYFNSGQADHHWYWSEALMPAFFTSTIELEFRSLVPSDGVILDEIHWFPFGQSLMIGTVDLQDFIGDCDGQEATFEFHAIPSGDLIRTETTTLEPGGRFELLIDPPGHCDVTVKTSHWLSYTVANQNILAGENSYLFHVENGDCDENNEVSIGDYSLLSAAFGSFDGDPNWNAMADLTGDGAVDIGDYAILSHNFGDFGS